MNYKWHELFSEVVCYGMTQQDLEYFQELSDTTFPEEAAFTSHEYVGDDDESLDD